MVSNAQANIKIGIIFKDQYIDLLTLPPRLPDKIKCRGDQISIDLITHILNIWIKTFLN